MSSPRYFPGQVGDQFSRDLYEETFKQKNHLRNSYICELCVKELSRRNIFDDHMKCKHGNSYYGLKGTYKCNLCNNELTSGRSFVELMKKKHS